MAVSLELESEDDDVDERASSGPVRIGHGDVKMAK